MGAYEARDFNVNIADKNGTRITEYPFFGATFLSSSHSESFACSDILMCKILSRAVAYAHLRIVENLIEHKGMNFNFSHLDFT